MRSPIMPPVGHLEKVLQSTRDLKQQADEAYDAHEFLDEIGVPDGEEKWVLTERIAWLYKSRVSLGPLIRPDDSDHPALLIELRSILGKLNEPQAERLDQIFTTVSRAMEMANVAKP